MGETAPHSLTTPAHSHVPWFRCRLWHFFAGIFRKQEPQWRWNLRCRQHFFVEYQYHCSLRFRPRRRLGSVLDILHPCPGIHKAIHLDHWYLKHPLRYWHCYLLLCETLLLGRNSLRSVWYLQHCTYIAEPVLPIPLFDLQNMCRDQQALNTPPICLIDRAFASKK